MKIIFLGSDPFAIPSLAALVGTGHQILTVVTQPDRPAGRGCKKTPCPVAIVAEQNGLQVQKPEKIADPSVQEALKSLKPDLFVVVAYGQFIPPGLIEVPPYKAVNIHPSLLPKYRGAAPIQWALLNGERKTGVSTMMITHEMDAGDIYLQCETTIDDAEDAETLHDRLSELGAELLLETLNGLETGTLKAKPQDPSKVVLAPKIKKEDGRLDFKEPAQKLLNRIRAFKPWPGTYCLFDGKRLKVLTAAVVDAGSQKEAGTVIDNQGGILIACGQQALCLIEVQLEGKQIMSAAEFLKGHPIRIGEKLS